MARVLATHRTVATHRVLSTSRVLRGAPGRVVGLVPTPGNATVGLAWTADLRSATYTVYRGLISGGETVLVTGITGTTYTDNAVSNGLTYYYIVRAVATGGQVSLPSLEVIATPFIFSQATNTAIVSSANPVVAGQPITLIAATAPAASNLLSPTGTITFHVDGVAKTPATLANGLATLTVPTLSAGNHSITAVYSGDSTFNSSTSATFTQVSNAAFVALPYGVNVTAHGVVNDGVTDNTTALNSLISSSPLGTLFYFPAGTYLVTGTISLVNIITFGMIGDVTATGAPASIILGTATSGELINGDSGPTSSCTFQISNIQFTANDAGQTAFIVRNAQSSTFQNCIFNGWMGMSMLSGYATAIRNCQFIGSSNVAGNTGIFADDPTECMISNSTFSGWTGQAFQAGGSGLSVINCTFSNNAFAMIAGANLSEGANFGLGRSSIENCTFTSNDYAIYCSNAGTCMFSNITIVGTGTAPSGQSLYGLYGHQLTGCTFSNLKISGGFSNIAAFVQGGEFTTFYNNSITNSDISGQGLVVNSGLTQVLFDSNPIGVTAGISPPSSAVIDNGSQNPTYPTTQGPILNVTSHGLVGNFSTDNTVAFQNLVNAATPGTIFYFPIGIYLISDTIDFSGLSSFTIIGDGQASGGRTYGSTIDLIAATARPLVKADYGSGCGTFQLINLNLRTSVSPGAVAIFTRNSILSTIQSVQTTSGIGIQAINSFALSVRSVSFNGSISGGSTVGIMVGGGSYCTIEGCDYQGWQECIRAAGNNLAIFGCRFEVNHIAMNLGIDQNGSSSPLVNSSVFGLSMEADDICIDTVNCLNCIFGAYGAQGTSNAPSGFSQIGHDIANASNCIFAAFNMSGAWSISTNSVSSPCVNVLFDSGFSGNSGGPAVWTISPSAINITKTACNN